MAVTQVSSVQEALRHRYHDEKVPMYLANDEIVFWNNMKRRKRRIAGRDHLLKVTKQRVNSAGIGITEAGSLPTALAPDTIDASIDNQEYVGTYQISWKLLQKASQDKDAFIKATKYMDENTLRPFMRRLNADLLDDGRGRLGVLSAADNNATVTNWKGIPNLEVGMVVDLMDTDNDTKNKDSITVSAVDLSNPSAPSVTFSAALASSGAGDYIVLEDTCDDSLNDSLHSHGVLGIVDNADPAAVVGDYIFDRGTAGNEFWESAVLSNSGTNRSLTEDLLLQATDAARLKGGGKIDKWFTNQAICRRYHELIRAESYINVSSGSGLSGGLGRKGQGEMAAEDGKTVYHIGGVPVYVDPYFSAYTMVGIDSSDWAIGVGDQEVPKPISDIFPETQFFRRLTTAAFAVDWYFQMQLLCENPAGQVKIEDIAHS